MKIKNIFESEELNNERIMVSLDNAEFNGLIRANQTASFILDCLKEDCTIETIVQQMITVYGISKEKAYEGVCKIVSQLKELNLLVE